MKIGSAIQHACVAIAAAALLAGCNGAAQSLPGASAQSQQNASGLSTHSLAALHTLGSWMSPKAKASTLLYISDAGTNEVYAYSYPKLVLMGTLTGFDDPQGLCVDNAGNVFVANREAAEILEYAHGGTTPIATLSDPGEDPLGCSVDSTTGNLAVTSNLNPGDVAIYTGATGTPTTYSVPQFWGPYYNYCAYDMKGDLYVNGKNSSGIDQFVELPKNSNTFQSITLNTTIEYAIAIQWDNGLVVGNTYEMNQIYRFKVKNGNGTEIGSPGTLNYGYGIVQFWVDGNVLIGPNPNYPNVSLWNYPAGGLPIHKITFSSGSLPVGATISKS